jgi:hypothetical protein
VAGSVTPESQPAGSPVPSVPAPAAQNAEPATPATAVARAERRLGSIRRRFGFAYFALAVAVGVALGLLAVLVGRSSSSGGPWSAFKPAAHGLEAAQQIATYVSSRYRLTGGQPLALALADAPVVSAQQQQVPISVVELQSGFSDQQAQDVGFARTNHSVMLQLRGTGTDGAIPGTPSVARGNLLRREVLEISLYTFKYLSEFDSVLAFPPPVISQTTGKATPTLIFLRRSDVRAELDRPLAETLPQRPVQTPTVKLRPGEQAAIGHVRFMTYSFQGLPDGTALLVAKPAS